MSQNISIQIIVSIQSCIIVALTISYILLHKCSLVFGFVLFVCCCWLSYLFTSYFKINNCLLLLCVFILKGISIAHILLQASAWECMYCMSLQCPMWLQCSCSKCPHKLYINCTVVARLQCFISVLLGAKAQFKCV